MTITVPITTLGVLRATELLQSARTDLALRHDRTTRSVSVTVEPGNAVASPNLSRQSRIVDLQV